MRKITDISSKSQPRTSLTRAFKRTAAGERASKASNRLLSTRKDAGPPRTKGIANPRRLYKSKRTPTTSVEEFTKQISGTIGRGTGSLAKLWNLLGAGARTIVVSEIGHYIGRWSEEKYWEDRAKLRRLITAALTKQLRALKTAHKLRLAFESIDLPERGKLVVLGGPAWLSGTEISKCLEAEIFRLEELQDKVKWIYNNKRFGRPFSHQNLVLAQDFVQIWSAQRSLQLKLGHEEISYLIDIMLEADGLDVQDFNRPENIKQALAEFRSNSRNTHFLQLQMLQAEHLSNKYGGA